MTVLSPPYADAWRVGQLYGSALVWVDVEDPAVPADDFKQREIDPRCWVVRDDGALVWVDVHWPSDRVGAWSPITGLRTPATPPRVKPIADNAAHLATVAEHVRWLFPLLEVEEDRARLFDALATGAVVTITSWSSGGFDVASSRPGNASQADGLGRQ